MSTVSGQNVSGQDISSGQETASSDMPPVDQIGEKAPGFISAFPLSLELDEALKEALDTLDQREVTLPNDRVIRYEVLGIEDGPCLVLANGLGGRLYTWLPLIRALAPHMKIITWDYCGLFDSSSEVAPENLTLPSHADDLAQILALESIETAHLVGWSMGVQVSLEFASRYGDSVSSLTLINGTYGQVFSTAFQPWFRAPLPTWTLHEIIESLKKYEGLTKASLWSASLPVELLFQAKSKFLGKERPMMLLAARQYCRDLFTGEHLQAYLTLFQHLDAHSVYHRLPQMTASTLVISGGIDFLTPPYQSRQIARRMPNATHKKIRLGSHFVILERPTLVVRYILEHLDKNGVNLGLL